MIGTVLLSVLALNAFPELSPRVPAAYEIYVFLNDSTRTLSGSEKISFVNPTSSNLETIAFHLYPNAFKDTSTVFCREDRMARVRVERGNISKVQISNVMIDNMKIDEKRLVIDGTRLYININPPLSPGSTIEIKLDFEILIPEMLGHFGYDSEGDYLLAHCFPILCGYQKGRLIDWDYHANSEFFSNFSFYDVIVELPENFKVVSTGEISMESENDSTAAWHARADTVIDFALVCGPDLVAFNSEKNGIKLNYLLKERHADFYPVADSIVKNSLQYCGDYIYPYPYSAFSVADVSFISGGLELPGMIVVGFFGPDKDITEVFLKKTIAHETAHQWFYATIATNEFEEAWLDEGFASFLDDKIARKYGFDKFPLIFPNFLNSDRSMRRLFSLMEGTKYPVNLRSWDYPDRHSYMVAVYERALMVLQALENVIGDSAFAEAIKKFAVNHRFDHPDQTDLLESISPYSSYDLSDFARMFVDGTSKVDYSIESVRFEKIESADDSATVKYMVYVNVERKYDGILPQVITLGLKDGTIIEQKWDGINRTARIVFESKSIPVYASLDRNLSYAIDENINNNTIYLKGHVTRMISFEWDAIFIIEFLASIFL